MNEQNKRTALLGETPIPKALLALGLPTMIGMLINALYNLADTYFVGGLGTEQMGAVTVAYPLGQVIVGLGLLFGNGAAACLSRLLGRGDKDTANRVASTALYSSVIGGAAAILCAVIFLKPILMRLGAIDSVMPYALSYSRIYIIFSIFNVFNVTMNNLVSSEGAAKTAMCALIGLAAALFSEGIISLFTKDDTEMIRIGQAALRANGLTFMVFGFHTVYSFLFLVMGKAKEGCILGASRQGICFVPAILILPRIFGLNGVWCAQPAADILAAAVTAVMAWRFHKSLNGK